MNLLVLLHAHMKQTKAKIHFSSVTMSSKALPQ